MAKALAFSDLTISELRRVSPDTRVSAIINRRRVKQRSAEIRRVCDELWADWCADECARIAMEAVKDAP